MYPTSKKGIIWRINDDESVDIWELGRSLSTTRPHGITLRPCPVTGNYLLTMVKELIHPVTGGWDFDLVQQRFHADGVKILVSVILVHDNMEDIIA